MSKRYMEEWEDEEIYETPAKKGKNKKKNKHILRNLLFLFLAFTGIVCLYISIMLNSVDRVQINDSHENLGIENSYPKKNGITNIALFGIDSRDDNGRGRSDAIMIASIDARHNKLKITSIMRDSDVTIDGYKVRKINSAYALGGPELAIKTLNQNFGMNIKDYVTVNFQQLADVIDALGGVDIDISEAVRKNANKYIKEVANAQGVKAQTIKKSGLQTLTGAQAVGYARVRYVGNADFERTERQREVLEKVFEKIMKKSPLAYPDMLARLLPMVETSLSNSEIMSLGIGLIIGGKPTFEQARFPITGEYHSNGSNLIYDLDAAAEKLHAFIYDDEPFYPSEEEE